MKGIKSGLKCQGREVIARFTGRMELGAQRRGYIGSNRDTADASCGIELEGRLIVTRQQ